MEEGSFPRGGEIERAPRERAKPRESPGPRGDGAPKASGEKNNNNNNNSIGNKSDKKKKKGKRPEKRWSEMKRTRQPLLESEKAEKAAVQQRKQQTAKQQEMNKKRKRGELVEPASEEEDDVRVDSAAASAAPSKARVLSFAALKEGSAVLAVVKAVNAHDVVLALPNNLLGYVKATELSDAHTRALRAAADNDAVTVPPLSALLSVGQWVRASVIALRTTPRHRVELSLRESVVNASLTASSVEPGLLLQCAVVSQEERGYVLSVGIAALTAFLPLAKASASAPLERGAVLWAVVDSLQRDAVSGAPVSVTLSAETSRVQSTALTASSALSVAQLLPGLLVKARVEKTLKNGLWIRFGDVFAGSVDMFHLADSTLDYAALRTAYTPGAKLKARVLTLDAASKHVTLTLRPRALTLERPSFKTALGAVVATATVTRVDFGIGLALRLGPASDASAEAAYAHVSRVSDSALEQLSERFRVGSEVRARVLDYAHCDELVSVTLRPSQIDAPLLSYADVHVGQPLSVRVVQVAKKGAVVALTDTLRGFVPVSQLAEVRVTDAAQRVHIGQTLPCRVLALDKARHRVLLTAKRALVEGAEEGGARVLASYADCTVGAQALGSVVSVHDFGLIVALWGDVKGLVPRSELAVAAPQGVDVSTLHRVGEVVRVRVLTCSPTQQQLTLSLRLSAALSPEQLEQRAKEYARAVIGAEYAVKVTLVTPRGLEVELRLQEASEPAKKRSKGKSSSASSADASSSALLGFVPLQQLSDDASSAPLALAEHSVGAELRALLVKCRAPDAARPLTFTLKPALRAACALGLVPLSNAALRATVQPGACVWGSVREVTPYGAWLQFLGGATALVHVSVLSDQFTKDPRERVAIGQTVCAYVLGVKSGEDSGKGQGGGGVDLALAASLVRLQDAHASVAATLVSELRALHDRHAARVAKAQRKRALKAVVRGAHVSGTVAQVEDMGLVLTLDEPLAALTGFVPRVHVDEKRHKVGEVVQARILDVDADKGIVDLTVLPNLLSEEEQEAKEAKGGEDDKKSKKKGKKPAEGAERAEVLLVHAPWAIVRYQQQFSCALAVHVNELCEASRVAPSRLPLLSRVSVRALSDQALMLEHAAERPNAPSLLRAATAAAPSTTAESSPSSSTPSPALVNAASELKVGDVVEAEVRDVFQTQVVLMIGHVKASLHISETRDEADYDAAALKRELPAPLDVHPLKQYTPGMKVRARIIRLDAAEKNAAKAHPLSKAAATKVAVPRVELSVRASVLNARDVQSALQRVAERPRWSEVGAGKAAAAVRKGSAALCWVHEVSADGLWVHLSADVRARVFVLDCHRDPDVLARLEQHFAPGMVVRGLVTRVDSAQREVDVSLRALHDASSAAPNTLRVGAVVPARVSKVLLGEGVLFQLFAHTNARAHLCDLDDAFDSDVLARWQLLAQQRAIVRVAVLAVARDDKGHARIDVSARASRLDPAQVSALPEYAREVSAQSVVSGQLVQGYVKASDKRTVWVSLARDVVARVFAANLRDKYVKHVAQRFPVGKAVRGRVLSVRDEERDGDGEREGKGKKKGKQSKDVADKAKDGGAAVRRIELTLKPSALRPRLTFEEVAIGAKLTGRVKSVTDFGVFVTLDGSALVGLAHISEAHDDFVKDAATLKKLYATGDRVRALVLRKNAEKKQLSLSLKPSHFSEADEDALDAEEDALLSDVEDEEQEEDNEDKMDADSDEEDEAERSDDDGEEEESADAAAFADSDDEEDDEEEEEEEEDDDDAMSVEEESSPSGKRKRGAESSEDEEDEDDGGVARKRQRSEGLSAGELDWNDALGLSAPKKGAALKDEDEESSSLELEDEPNKKKKKEKKEKKEAGASASASSDMSGDDFERALLATPQSSALWIGYMSFFLSRALVEKARGVAERALQRIDASFEEEKRNVFIALLQLEHKFGDAQRLKAALARALQYCAPKPIYRAAIAMHSAAGETARVDELCKALLAKHGKDASVWTLRAKLLLERNEAAVDKDVRALLARALAVLQPRKHVRVIAKMAQLAYRHARAELGRALLEDLLTTYSKRLDLWTLLLDQEERLLSEAVSEAQVGRVRALYERVTAMKVRPVKKMKGMFKRFLAFEQTHGDEQRLELVKTKAQKYVQGDE